MQNLWFYARGGAVQGPFSTEQMTDLVQRKRLHESDSVWRENAGRSTAVPARDVFEFPAKEPLPDWLADVAVASATPAPALISAPLPDREDPEWLDDLRLWVGLEVFARAQEGETLPAEIKLEAPGKLEGLPEWLENWLPPPKVKPSPVPPAPEKAAPQPTLPTPIRPAPAPPPAKQDSPAPPVAPPAIKAPALPLGAKPPTPAPVARAPVMPPPAVNAPAAPAARQITPAEKMREESGFDADTGQILDPVKFRRWQKQAQSASAPLSNASILETFRQFRSAVDSWVDDDKNRLRMLHAEMDEICAHPDVQRLLTDAGKFGTELREKVMHYLGFMVENRRKYYKALAERR